MRDNERSCFLSCMGFHLVGQLFCPANFSHRLIYTVNSNTPYPTTLNHWQAHGSRRLFITLMLLIMGSLAGCNTAAGLLNNSNRATILGTERADSPLAAAEAYMRQYQPGDLPRIFQTTRIYDRDGTLIGEMFGEGRRVGGS